MNGSMGTSQTVRVVPDNGNGAASKQILDDLDRISKKVADYGQKMAQGLSRVTQHVKAENDKRIADDRRTTDKQLAEQQRLDAAREQIMHRARSARTPCNSSSRAARGGGRTARWRWAGRSRGSGAGSNKTPGKTGPPPRLPLSVSGIARKRVPRRPGMRLRRCRKGVLFPRFPPTCRQSATACECVKSTNAWWRRAQKTRLNAPPRRNRQGRLDPARKGAAANKSRRRRAEAG